MSRLRPSFAERRRRTLTLRIAQLDRMEPRSTVTPIGLAAFAVGTVPLAAQLGSMHANRGG